MKEIAAGIIIYRRTQEGPKFLILYHGHGYWNFAKGKIEAEEKSFQTALREIKEETGLGRNDLSFNSHFRVNERYDFWRKQMRVFKIVIFYLAETKNPYIKISSEHEGYGWFTYKEAMRLLTKHKDSQRVLTQAYDFLRPKSAPRRQQHPAR